MEIRRLTEEDRPAALRLTSLAFSYGRKREDWEQDAGSTGLVGYGVWDDGGLQAQVIILDYHIRMGEHTTLPMGGIAGVACMPAARGRGYVRAALIRALEHMYSSGQVVSMLFPFSYDYYARVGWEWIGVERRYSVPSTVLPPSDETQNCRHALPEDREAIAEAYRLFSGRYRGMVARDKQLWDRLLEDTREAYTTTLVHESHGRIDGYLTFRGGSGECTDLNEFICLTAAARRGLMGILRRMSMQTRRFAWSAPADDGLWHDLCDHAVHTQIAPVTQARVVDVSAALRAFRPFSGGSGTFWMGILDESAPWNSGTWRVHYTPSQVTVAAARRPPQINMDIRAFTHLFMGSATAHELARHGRIEVCDADGLEAAQRLFAGPIPWMNDHF